MTYDHRLEELRCEASRLVIELSFHLSHFLLIVVFAKTVLIILMILSGLSTNLSQALVNVSKALRSSTNSMEISFPFLMISARTR